MSRSSDPQANVSDVTGLSNHPATDRDDDGLGIARALPSPLGRLWRLLELLDLRSAHEVVEVRRSGSQDSASDHLSGELPDAGRQGAP